MQARHSECPFLHPVGSKFASFRFVKDFLNRFTVDHARAAGANCELTGSAATPRNVFLNADLVHHVHNRAKRSDRFGVRKMRRITAGDHCFESCFHQVDHAAVKHLFLKVVALGFLLKRHANTADSQAANRLGQRQYHVQRVAGHVLLD